MELEAQLGGIRTAQQSSVPSHAHESLRITCEELRSRLATAEEAKEKALVEAEYLMGEYKKANSAYTDQQSSITTAQRHSIDIEKRNMELCWQQVEWKAQLESLQEAVGRIRTILTPCQPHLTPCKSHVNPI